MVRWGHLFSPRQLLTLTSLVHLVEDAGKTIREDIPADLRSAIQTILGLGVSRYADICNTLCTWSSARGQLLHAFTRQAIPFIWDFAEPYLFGEAAGDYQVTLNSMIRVLEQNVSVSHLGIAAEASARQHPLPDGMAAAVVTDPPYYDAVPYAYLSDFFYVWLKRSVGRIHPALFERDEVPKDEEIVVDRPHELSNSTKDIAFYERELTGAFSDGRRLLRRDGIAVIVFASKTTASWEAILQAVVDAGWTITGSWPVDTEREVRLAAQGQARLASSVHLVCRPRSTQEPGDWRDVLTELPRRIHEWMPRLASEGVVGADAIFACLGPALEIFSR
jgi:adenine-specific DNA methylase